VYTVLDLSLVKDEVRGKAQRLIICLEVPRPRTLCCQLCQVCDTDARIRHYLQQYGEGAGSAMVLSPRPQLLSFPCTLQNELSQVATSPIDGYLDFRPRSTQLAISCGTLSLYEERVNFPDLGSAA